MEHYEDIDLKGNNLQNVNAIEDVADGVLTSIYGQDSSGDLVKDPNPPVKDFTDLDDTPSTYAGESGKIVAVKSTEDGLEFVSAPSGTLPNGSENETLRHNGTSWEANDILKIIDGVASKNIEITSSGQNATYGLAVSHNTNKTTANYAGRFNNKNTHSSGLPFGIVADIHEAAKTDEGVAVQCNITNSQSAIRVKSWSIAGYQFEVKSDGTILSQVLEGTGDRPVLADADGKLKTDDTVATVKRVKRTLTPNEIRALHTTPIELIPAPGAGKIIVIHKAVYYYVYGTAVYETTSSDDVIICWEDTNGDTATDESLHIYSDTDNQIIVTSGSYAGQEPYDHINKAMTIEKYGSTAFTGATATGTVDIIVEYTIVDFN